MMQNSRGQVLLLSILILGALLALGLAEQQIRRPDPHLLRQAEQQRVQWVDRPAPSFDLPLLEGGRLRSSDLEGRPVLIHFWASWCSTCLTDLPLFSELQRRYGSRLRIVHVSLDEEVADARRVLPAGWNMEVPLDPSGAVAHAFGTEKLPEAYLLDDRSRVLLRFVANQPWDSPRVHSLLDGFLR